MMNKEEIYVRSRLRYRTMLFLTTLIRLDILVQDTKPKMYEIDEYSIRVKLPDKES